MINVQFTDASAQIIQAYLASPQDPDLWPNQGTVSTSDPRWKTFYDAVYPFGPPMWGGMPEPTTD
jgi:hypothetical protein